MFLLYLLYLNVRKRFPPTVWKIKMRPGFSLPNTSVNISTVTVMEGLREDEDEDEDGSYTGELILC